MSSAISTIFEKMVYGRIAGSDLTRDERADIMRMSPIVMDVLVLPTCREGLLIPGPREHTSTAPINPPIRDISAAPRKINEGR